jgi:hypothetical protein
MKHFIPTLLCAAALAGVVACEEKPKTLGEKVKDGLDVRPNEKLKDAGEDVKDAAKDAKDAVKDAVK